MSVSETKQHLNLTRKTRRSRSFFSNPRISEGKPSAESQADSESKESPESSSTESKTITESTTLKNPNKALPNINNSAQARTIIYIWQSLTQSFLKWGICESVLDSMR